MLRFLLFGAPQFEDAGAPVPLRHSKPLAMLAYLALSDQPRDRDTLLALLWPEFDASSARNNLRRELSRSKATLGLGLLQTDRQQVRWSPQTPVWIDVVTFQSHLAAWKQHGHPPGAVCAVCATELAAAVQLYRDDFMAGFSLLDSPAFDEWQFFWREQLRQQLADALEALIAWHRAAGSYGVAIDYARRWLALDVLHEPAQRELMRLYAWSGQHAAALRQYAECVRVLDAELGVEPEPETTALFQAVKARRVTPAAQPPRDPPPQLPTAQAASAKLAPAQPLPVPPTPLVGRDAELAALDRLLAEPTVRLITILGPGGIGKTRLALACAERQRPAFADGVCFVALQSVGTPALLAPAIADALGCRLAGTEPPPLQLVGYLRDKQLLLVLDNLEHLLDGVELLGELLAAVPGVRLLVTSREALNLQQEWLHPLHGLEIPPADGEPASYAAVQCFVERARRVRPDFSLQREQAGVVRICRLVEGLPLALELAAAWCKTLSSDAIADEIAHNLGFLATRLRDVPPRHRSMRAAVDASWELLAAEAQAVFARLSVFRGGFGAEAAFEVAGATLPELATLVDGSLLRVDASVRYTIHELLRQYAADRLHETPDDEARALAAHSAYFVRFLEQRLAAIFRGQDGEATAEIAAEFANLPPAWRHALETGDLDALGRAIASLTYVYQYRGLYADAIAVCEQLIDRLRGGEMTRQRTYLLTHTLNGLAWVQIRAGNLQAARAALDESLPLFEHLAEPAPPGRGTDPLAALATLAQIEGNYAAAVGLGEQLLERSRANNQLQNVAFAWNLLARAAHAQGIDDKARYAAEQAYAATEASGDRWFRASVLNQLGEIALAQGRLDVARHHHRAGFAIREEFADPEGMALALVLHAKVALAQHAFSEARELYTRGLALYHSTTDRSGSATALHGLGMAACALGDYDAAARALHEALGLAHELHLTALTLAILTSGAELLLRSGLAEPTREVLLVVLRNPATDQPTGQRVQHLLLDLGDSRSTGADDAGVTTEPTADVDTAVARLLVMLATTAWPAAATEAAAAHSLASAPSTQ